MWEQFLFMHCVLIWSAVSEMRAVSIRMSPVRITKIGPQTSLSDLFKWEQPLWPQVTITGSYYWSNQTRRACISKRNCISPNKGVFSCYMICTITHLLILLPKVVIFVHKLTPNTVDIHNKYPLSFSNPRGVSVISLYLSPFVQNWSRILKERCFEAAACEWAGR